MMRTSSRFQLNRDDWRRIGKGALLAAGGAVVAYLTSEVLPNLDQSTLMGATLAALASTLLNLARKWMAHAQAN